MIFGLFWVMGYGLLLVLWGSKYIGCLIVLVFFMVVDFMEYGGRNVWSYGDGKFLLMMYW